MANNWGGYRPGSGRKPLTDEYSEFFDKIREGAIEVVPILIEKANAGEMDAIKYLMNRAFGCPRRAFDIEAGQSIIVVDDLHFGRQGRQGGEAQSEELDAGTEEESFEKSPRVNSVDR
jgi:hypothetical protein